MRTLSWSPSTSRAWGWPSVSWYWTTKESNGPRATPQERRRESGVASVTASVPRRGASGASVGFGADVSTSEAAWEKPEQNLHGGAMGPCLSILPFKGRMTRLAWDW